mmetsp:Transcript_118546/g.369240  ORF Transcript_118546/g.369240 Transcript_118546/m.369240 type:complete len:223 (+) Transcript_118546:1945-2613(+)
MSTSMLSVAVASCRASLAATRVKRMVPVSARRLTELFTVPMTPSSRTFRKPPRSQPAQQGAGLPNLAHSEASADQATAPQKLAATSGALWTIQSAQWFALHCASSAGTCRQKRCIFAKCSREMLRSIQAKKVSTAVSRERKSVRAAMRAEGLMPAVAERSPGGMVPAALPGPWVPTRSSIICEGYLPKNKRKVPRRRQLLPVRVNWPTATSRTLCLRRCRSR